MVSSFRSAGFCDRRRGLHADRRDGRHKASGRRTQNRDDGRLDRTAGTVAVTRDTIRARTPAERRGAT
ncbi:hypothetical protein Q0Z83_070970 [Actinoplanes sichuanensis]|nr:hypothetical protein Q0Z83_070970 [Actinoplanes sichuanensis]